MIIEWTVVATIGAPILALLIGVWLDRKFEKRPKLISFFGHISSFHSTPPNGNTFDVFTHVVVVRNAGRLSATNVRLHHRTLPSFDIQPSIKFQTEILPDGTQDIVIPILVAGEQITISYLYFPPLTYADVNEGIKCDQGLAKQIPVLVQRQFSKLTIWLINGLIVMGAVSLLYVLYSIIGAALT